jgi:hypothetical protein
MFQLFRPPAPLPGPIREKFERRLLEENTIKIKRLGLMQLLFFAFFLFLDLVRWKGGLFAENSIYIWLFVTHLIAGISAIPALVLIPVSDYGRLSDSRLNILQNAHFGLFILLMVPMSAITIIERSSVIPYAIFMLVSNLSLHIKPSIKTITNIVSTTIVLATTWWVYADDIPKLSVTALRYWALFFRAIYSV